MKHVRRIFISVIVLAIAFIIAFAFNQNTEVNATGEVTDANLIVKGAGVRTAGDAGIRFEIEFKDYEVPTDKTIKAYGAVIGYGDVKDITLLTKGGTVNGQAVLNCEIAEPDEVGTYFISIYGIPQDYYTQDITARAYVVLSDDSLVYGAANAVRNLTQVVVAAYNDPGFTPSENLLKTIHDAIEFKELDDTEIEKINAINPDVIVSTADASKNIVVLKEAAGATKTLNKTYEYKPYSTITAALANSFKNYSVYVMDGTYNEAVNANVEGLKLYGSNYGVNGRDITDGVTISNTLTISANNVTIDGFKLTKTAVINANNATINHTAISATPDQTCIGNNRKGLIVDGIAAGISNFTLKNSLLDVLGTGNDHTFNYMSFTKITNLTMTGNLIRNNPSALGTSEGMMIYNMYGALICNSNEFRFATNGYIMRPTYNDTVAFNKVEFNDNIVAGSSTLATSSVFFKYLANNSTAEVIGNTFYNSKGTTLMFDYAKSGTKITVAYNTFDENTSFKGGSSGSADININGNYFKGGISADDKFGAASSENFTNAADLATYYAKYKANETSSINYVLDGGDNSSKNLDTYVEGGINKIYPATSTTMNFVGWTLEPTGTNYISYIPFNKTGDITLYAHWTSIITVSLSADDTRVINQYNPTKFVKAEFTSGTYKINGNDYSVADNELFSTVNGAISKAQANDVIYVFAGDYTAATVTLSKVITIVGPNADVNGAGTRGDEARINATDWTMNSSITMNGLYLTATTGATLFKSNQSGDSSKNATLVDVSNCVFDTYQNVLRYENANAAKDFKAYMINNKFKGIAQFIIWSRNNEHLTRFDFIGNTITNTAWGGTAQNSNIRIDKSKSNCVINIIGNDFLLEPTLYSATCGFIGCNVTTATCVVKYNKFVATTAANLQNYFKPATKNTTITDNVFVAGSIVQTTEPTVTLGTGSTISGAITEAARATAYATYLSTYTK